MLKRRQKNVLDCLESRLNIFGGVCMDGRMGVIKFHSYNEILNGKIQKNYL